MSDQKIKLILNNPARTETGIAPRTVAKMKRNDTPKRKEELWVMYQEMAGDKRPQINNKRLQAISNPKRVKVISTWRYPGVSPKREVPVPQDILEELSKDES